MSILIYGALFLWPIVHLIRRKLLPSEVSPRRRRRDRAGNRALRGLPLGAVVGALVYPTALFALSLLLPAAELLRGHQIPSIEFLQRLLTVPLIAFVPALFFWFIGILLLIPVWSMMSGFWNLGPLAASVLGGCAAALVAVYCQSTIVFEFARTPLLALLAERHLEQLSIAWMGLAGAVSGTTVWWTGHNADVIKARFAKCPIICARA